MSRNHDICDKSIAELATSIFAHNGAIPLPSRETEYFDAHPVLSRRKGITSPHICVWIDGKRFEQAKLARTGRSRDGEGKYQLMLGREATERVMRLCTNECEAWQREEILPSGARFTIQVSDTEAVFWMRLYWPV